MQDTTPQPMPAAPRYHNCHKNGYYNWRVTSFCYQDCRYCWCAKHSVANTQSTKVVVPPSDGSRLATLCSFILLWRWHMSCYYQVTHYMTKELNPLNSHYIPARTCTIVMVQFGWRLFGLPSQSVGTHLSRCAHNICGVSSHKTHKGEELCTCSYHEQCGKLRKLNKVHFQFTISLYLVALSHHPMAPLCVGSSWLTSAIICLTASHSAKDYLHWHLTVSNIIIPGW